jgi:hypothetical protein
MNQLVNPQSDKSLGKRAASGTINAIVSSILPLAVVWELSKALFGNAIELRQQRALEWVEMIRDSPDVISEQVMNSEEFQDGFVTTLQNYLTLRTERKREVVREVFLDFASSIDKPNFQLERFTDTAQKISPSSIALLGFIKQEVLPLKEKLVKEKMASDNLGTEKPYEWWFDLNMKREPVSKYFEQWISDNFSPNSPVLKAKYGKGKDKIIPDAKTFELMEIERTKRDQYNAPISELVYLGLVSTGVNSDGGWSGGTSMSWTLTSFAQEFMQYIELKPDEHLLLVGRDHSTAAQD